MRASKTPTELRDQAKYLVSDLMQLLEAVVIKHTTAVLEELKAQFAAHAEEIATLRAKLAEAEKDAGRYGWVRARLPLAEVEILASHSPQPGEEAYSAQVDVAIDAAMQKEPGHE